jgi:hypothetical protein
MARYTQRHYQQFAEIISELRRCQYDRATLDALETELCMVFGRDNARFSASRFIDAANGSPSPRNGRGRRSTTRALPD